MSKYCVIQTTFKSRIEAKKITKILLENKLIACAQISTIESVYYWKQKVFDEKEFLLSIKTKAGLYKKIQKLIIQNHPYQTPQIILLPIKNGSKAYFDWIESVIH